VSDAREVRRQWWASLGRVRGDRRRLPSALELRELTLDRNAGTFVLGALFGGLVAAVGILAVWVLG